MKSSFLMGIVIFLTSVSCVGKKTATNPIIEMKTSMGMIKIELNQEKAPISTKNFLTRAGKKEYNGTVFHRVISNFMIQGGGFKLVGSELQQKESGNSIKNESQNGLSNTRGTIAMARTADPDSATAQFYINVKDNSGSLDYPKARGNGYTVFGKVIEGMDVVDKIKIVATGSSMVQVSTPGGLQKASFSDVPRKPVVIEAVRIMSPKG